MKHSQHLLALEAEAIAIMRECAAVFKNPVLLYSIGKDSSVLLHLARKAFAPATIPFPLLHIDTTYKFKEMLAFRDHAVAAFGARLIVHTNTAALEAGITPFTHDAGTYTQQLKTVPLREALDRHGFDVAIGGARRDEERARAKEHIFSLRGAGHTWEPRAQRPEFFTLYNNRIAPLHTMRAFPLSNWNEIDIWRYIEAENIDVVPLYFAAKRPVILRNGQWIMQDDARLQPRAGEHVEEKLVRFRTLGCYPFTAAVESTATNVAEIIAELLTARSSERVGRVIDHGGSSMEDKKREGYF